MPSVNSRSRPNVWPSSTFTTPSLPTFSIASAMTSPISSSPAEIVATRAIWSLPEISVDCSLMFATIWSTAVSMPFLRASGFAPAATFFRPSRTMAWARTVAVVVPSPATSLVAVATSRTSWAPWFSKTSSTSTSRAMDTPSLVIVGAPNFLSSTTFRPFGPSVTFTASASLFTPASRPRRASSSNFRILAMTPLLLDDGEHVARREDQQVVAFHRDLGAAVLAVDDGVPRLDVHGDQLTGVLRPLAGTDGEDFALLRLLLGGVGDDEAAGGRLLGFTGLDDDAVVEGLEVHTGDSCLGVLLISTLKCR